VTAATSPPEAPILEIRAVSKRFGSLVVLDEVDLRLGPREVLGVVGPNGAGKSTLLDVIAGVQRPQAGRVLLAGADVTAAAADRRCLLGLGRTYQIPRPFVNLTAFENVLIAALRGARLGEREAQWHAWRVVERLDLARLANTRAGSLRLLDRKRLELARALATSPRVLLLDEIAAGLTERETEQLIDLIRGVRATGVAIVWIEHVVQALAQVVDRMLCLAFGRVISEGPAASVLSDPQVVEVYLGRAAP
jgi:branched-chain amino acid transport system ATP-binding protein